MMREAVIVDAVRTPMGKRDGMLKNWHPVDLLGHTLGGLVQRNKLKAELVDDVTGGLGVGGLAAPVGVTSAMPVIIQDVVPLGEADVDRGDPVHALDGEIGRVQGFLVDPDDHRVTHVLLEEGHLWGRKKVSIPVSAVTGVENGIRLSLTKKQIEDLPPAG